MASGLNIRPVAAEDHEAWLAMWHAYCQSLGATVPDDVTTGVWQRIMTADEPL